MITGPPLKYEHAMRILLEGVCGSNGRVIAQEMGLNHKTVMNFLNDSRSTHAGTVDAIGMFIWRKLNAHLLISDDDRLKE